MISSCRSLSSLKALLPKTSSSALLFCDVDALEEMPDSCLAFTSSCVCKSWTWTGFSRSLAEITNHLAKVLKNGTACLKWVKRLLLTPLITEAGLYFSKLVQLSWKLGSTGLDSFYKCVPIVNDVRAVAMKYHTQNSVFHLQKLIVCRKEWQRKEKITWTKAFVLAPSG